jgi:selenocysteine lyase/cysteine desulfurase
MNNPDYLFINNLSNVTGKIIEFDKIINIFNEYDVIKVVDGAQSFGLLDINYSNKDIDFLVFAGHKNLYGPFGIGGYIDFKSKGIESLIKGGTGSNSLNITDYNYEEAASKNITSIYALNRSIEWLLETKLEKVYLHKKELTEYLIRELKEIREVQMYLDFEDLENYLGIVSFNHKDYLPDELGQILDEDFDIAVRTGYHCAPFIHEILNTKKTLGVVRVSLSYFNKKEEIDYLIKCLKEL